MRAACTQISLMTGHCALCGREETLTRHHLIPRTRHHNKRNQREFTRAEVKVTVGFCRPCHAQVHAVLSEKELERAHRTVETLRAHPEIAKFVAWIAAKPRGFKPQVRSQRR
jgi:hypothetical protein